LMKFFVNSPFSQSWFLNYEQGDANVDHTIDLDDYALIDAGYLLNRTGWSNGDFDYSGGKPDLDDYALIDAAYLSQFGSLSTALTWLEHGGSGGIGDDPASQKVVQHFGQFGPEFADALFAVTPEPAGVGILAGLGTALGGRVRRRSRSN
ncbi:MAG: hypothetical protein ACREJC_17465, partial [Tepidisphaeraceae bacterium]